VCSATRPHGSAVAEDDRRQRVLQWRKPRHDRRHVGRRCLRRRIVGRCRFLRYAHVFLDVLRLLRVGITRLHLEPLRVHLHAAARRLVDPTFASIVGVSAFIATICRASCIAVRICWLRAAFSCRITASHSRMRFSALSRRRSHTFDSLTSVTRGATSFSAAGRSSPAGVPPPPAAR